MLRVHWSLSPQSRLLERSAQEPWLFCTHPVWLQRLNPSASLLLHAIRDGTLQGKSLSPTTEAFLERCTAQGVLHRRWTLHPAKVWPRIEVIIPVYGKAHFVLACLQGLTRQRCGGRPFHVSVVDDASPQPLAPLLMQRSWPFPLRVLRLPRNQGPAAARNAAVWTPWGAEAEPRLHPEVIASTRDPQDHAALLAFVDADCVPRPHWLATLVALLETQTLSAAGTCVEALNARGLLGAYEAACSPLYAGRRSLPVGSAESPLSDLPSCNLCVRRSAFLSRGGFRSNLRFGEDADLCWRLVAAGQRIFYWAEGGGVRHAHRRQAGAFFARRRCYARSEADLRALHVERFPGGACLGLHGVFLCALWATWGGGAGAGWTLLGWSAAWSLWPLLHLHTWLRTVGRFPTAQLGSSLGLLLRTLLRRNLALWGRQARTWMRRDLIWALPLGLFWPILWVPIGTFFLFGCWAEHRVRHVAEARPRLHPWRFLWGNLWMCLAYGTGWWEGQLCSGLKCVPGMRSILGEKTRSS